jgi:hypothetical protein
MTQKPNPTHFYKKVPLEQIKAFCTLVETKDLSKTANICASSNATICLYISSLEKELGCELFVTKREYELTEKGKTHYEKAKIILKEVKEFYGSEEFDIKINKFDIYKFRLIKSIISLFKFIIRKFKVFVRMFLRVRYVVLVILFSIFNIDLVLERYLKSEFHKRNNIALEFAKKNILEIDLYSKNKIRDCLFGLNEMMKNKSQINLNDLLKIKNVYNISRVSLIDKNGLSTDLDTDREREDVKKWNEKYKNDKTYFSIFQSTCEEYKNLQNNNDIVITPIVLSKMRQIPVKWGITFNHKLNQYLYVEYSRDFFVDILQKISNTYKEIDYISLSDPRDSIIALHGVQNKNSTLLSKQIGYFDVDDMSVCFLKKLGLNEYSYTLKIAFSKTELNKEIRQIRLILLAITTLSLLVVYTVWMVQKQPTGGRRKK